MTWTAVAKVGDVSEGKPKIVPIGKQEVGIFHEGGSYYAVLNHCPHAGAPICKGEVTGMVVSSGPGQQGYNLENKVLRCPWHHWEFYLDTGKAVTPIKQRIRTYPVKVENDEILVAL